MDNRTRHELSHFVFAADGNYVLQIRVAVASLLHACRRKPRTITVHILDLGIADSDYDALVSSWRAVGSFAVVRRHRVDKSIFSGFAHWNGSVATYARLLLPSQLPDVDWCLYADGDTFFVKDPDELIFSLDDAMAMVGHLNPPSITDAIDGPWLKNHHLDFKSNRYVCAGLVLLNLRHFRDEGLQSKAFAFLKEFPAPVSADQCVLNVICFGRVGLLPEGWGAFTSEAAACGCCGCVHFSGVAPWRPPRNWMFYCGEDGLVDVWYEFAERVLGEQDLRRRFQPFRSIALHKMVARVLYPLVCVCAKFRLYPSYFSDHARMIRKRMAASSVQFIRRNVFG